MSNGPEVASQASNPPMTSTIEATTADRFMTLLLQKESEWNHEPEQSRISIRAPQADRKRPRPARSLVRRPANQCPLLNRNRRRNSMTRLRANAPVPLRRSEATCPCGWVGAAVRLPF